MFGCFCGLGPPLATSASLQSSRDQNGPISTETRSAANGYAAVRLDNNNNVVVQTSGPVLNPHNFEYIINEPGTCQGDVFLLVLICSRPDNFEQRSAIRNTWGTHALVPGLRTKILFMLGEPQVQQQHNLDLTLQGQIKNESLHHHDLIQENFMDSYENLTLKSIAILKWTHLFCAHAQYLLKTDDDMYINIPVLLKDLVNTVHHRFIMGEMIAGAEPIRDPKSKWYTPIRLYPYSRYPKYVSGTGYVISGDLVEDLYSSALRTELFWIEDVYITGLCAEKANALHVSNGKFGYRRRILSPCLFRVVITAHRMKPTELERMWRELSRPDLHCDYAKVHWNVLS